MDTLQKKILCPSILNLSTDNMREEIEKLDATDMDISCGHHGWHICTELRHVGA